MAEQEAAMLLEAANPAPQPWVSRRVLGGVVCAVGLICTATQLTLHRSSKQAAVSPEAKMAFMQAQGGFPGPYGAQQGYGAGGGVQVAAPLPDHGDFIPFAQAQAMAGNAAAAAPAAPAAAGFPGPYGAQQGYGAGVGHGPMGAPIATHPEDFVAHGDAPAQNQAAVMPSGGNADKPVTLNVFYETKCPFSLQFIDGEVKPALMDGTCVFQHVHINWEPYGNVQDAGGALTCQHGDDECFGNKLHICAKQHFGDNDAGLNDWIKCHMEYLAQDQSHQATDEAGYMGCPGADGHQLAQCAQDPSIFEAFRKVGAETLAAHSEHMPWAITGDGAPNLQGRLVQGLCEMYGTGALAAYPKPACCG